MRSDPQGLELSAFVGADSRGRVTARYVVRALVLVALSAGVGVLVPVLTSHAQTLRV